MVQLCDKIDFNDLPQFLAVVGDKYVAEIKEDGDRIRLRMVDGKVFLSNRRMKDVTEVYPEMHTLSGSKDFFIDGEMCVLDDKGVSQFNTGISHRSHCKGWESVRNSMAGYPVTFVVFDILELDGENLRAKPYSERRAILETMGLEAHPNIKLVERFNDIKDAWDKMVREEREGLILKNRDSIYKEGFRSSNWKKVKNIKEVDLKFTKFDQNPQGITVENNDGIRCLVGGRHQYPVKEQFAKHGEVVITIRHLGKTKAGKYRQPVFAKIVEE